MRGQFSIVATPLLMLVSLIAPEAMAEVPTLNVVPSAIEYEDASVNGTAAVRPPAQVMVILRNPSDKPLSDIAIGVFPTGYAATKITASTRPSTQPSLELAGGAEMSWYLELPQDLPRPLPDGLHVRVTYRSGEPGKLVNHILTTSVDVKHRKRETVSEVADIKLLSDVETVEDAQEINLVLSVENKSDTQLQIASISPTGDSFVKFDGVPTQFNVIAPHHIDVVRFNGKVEKQISPGKRTLSVKIDLAWGPSGQSGSGSIMASRDFTLAVKGVSEILGTLGLPSLLVLPGYLIVICFLTVTTWGTEKASTLQLWKDIAKPITLIIALTLSFVMAWTYEHKVHRSFSRAYGWTDVMWIWSISIGMGVVCGAIGVVGRYLNRRYVEAETARRTYLDSDSPAELLRKVELNGGGWTLPFTTVKHNGNDVRLYKLPEKTPGAGKHWVAPLILIDPKGDTGSAERKELEDALNAPATLMPGQVATLIDSGSAKGWKVTWKGGHHPVQIEAATFTEAGREAILEFE